MDKMSSIPNNYLKIRNKFKYFAFLCIYYFLFLPAKILYGRKRNWIICERGFDAQDNGFFFYKYLCKTKCGINATYIIKKNSPDFNKVKCLGKIVEYGSFKHFLMVIGCPVKISSHLYGYAPWVQMTLFYRRNIGRELHVFLQHGIIKNAHEGLYGDVCKSLKIFICGAKPEYEFIRDTFGYKNGAPIYTGLPRYDNLIDYKTKNQILFMPTWRRNISNLSLDEFKKTSFFKHWNELLYSQELEKKCLDKKIIIKLFLHPALQKFSPLFKNSQNVRVTYYGDENVQSLLKDSKLLVTDYSSVYFDFAYMNKPIVYYQYDEDDYYFNHYHKGYFDYRRDGFGDVCIDCKTAELSIINAIDNCFLMNPIYFDKANLYFSYRDDKNCERVFNVIKQKSGMT